MRGIDKIIKKELKKKKKSKIILNNSLFNVTPDMEFAKWLDYKSIEEQNRIDYLSKLSIEELTNNQIEELKFFNEQKIYSRLLNKYAYNLNECSNDEYFLACTYMKTHSIDDLMNNKLTLLEQKIAKDKIYELYNKLSTKDILNYLNSFNTSNDINAYKNMNIIDSYIFHYLSNLVIDNKITIIDSTMINNKVYSLNNLNYKVN